LLHIAQLSRRIRETSSSFQAAISEFRIGFSRRIALGLTRKIDKCTLAIAIRIPLLSLRWPSHRNASRASLHSLPLSPSPSLPPMVTAHETAETTETTPPHTTPQHTALSAVSVLLSPPHPPPPPPISGPPHGSRVLSLRFSSLLHRAHSLARLVGHLQVEG
jgi:hypothetical protein